jgi:hypothetical protein
LFNAEMFILAGADWGNGLASLAFAMITVRAFQALSWTKRLPAHRARLKTVQLLALAIACVALVTLPLALESFFRIWDPSYVYNGS